MENNEDLAIEQSLRDFENLEMETQHSYASALNSGNFIFLLHKSGEGNKSLKAVTCRLSWYGTNLSRGGGVNLSHSLLLWCKNLNSKLEKEKETQTFTL